MIWCAIIHSIKIQYMYIRYKAYLSILLLFIVNSLTAKDSITVYLFLLDECRICQELMPEINKIYLENKNDFGFVGVFPNFSSKKEGIENFKNKYGVSFPTKTDYFKQLSHKFGATVTPEVIVYNESQKQLLYQGAINDLFYAPGKRKHFVSNNYLNDVLSDIKGNTPIKKNKTESIGCFINFNDFN